MLTSEMVWHLNILSISSKNGYYDILLTNRLIASRATLGWLSLSLLRVLGCLSLIEIDQSLDIQEGLRQAPLLT